MSNYPAGVTWNDPHFGPDWERELIHFCPTCGAVVDGMAEETSHIVIFWHTDLDSNIHEVDITEEWYPGCQWMFRD